MRKSINKRLEPLSSEDPSINEQNEHVYNWWKQLATAFNPEIHWSFINDLPLDAISKFMIKKGIVPNATEAFRMY
jgi:hypothetical protein